MSHLIDEAFALEGEALNYPPEADRSNLNGFARDSLN